jgi:hypothetical protein
MFFYHYISLFSDILGRLIFLGFYNYDAPSTNDGTTNGGMYEDEARAQTTCIVLSFEPTVNTYQLLRCVASPSIQKLN